MQNLLEKQAEKVLTEYFKVLMDDGVINASDVMPHDISWLSARIASAYYSAESELNLMEGDNNDC
jgi:hypothetical protein